MRPLQVFDTFHVVLERRHYEHRPAQIVDHIINR